MKTLRSPLFAATLVPTLWACGQPGDQAPSNPVLKLEMDGRKVHRLIPEGDANGDLMLTEAGSLPNMLGFRTAPESDLVVWALYNTDESEKVDQKDLSTHARLVLDHNFQLFRVMSHDLGDDEKIIKITDNLISVSFPRYAQGVLVRDAFVELIYARHQDGTWRLREVVNGSHGDLTIDQWGESPPDWSTVQQKYSLEKYDLVTERDLIYTIRGASRSRLRHSMAREFQVKDRSTDVLHILTVECGTFVALEAYASLYSAGPQPLLSSVYKRTYLEPERMNKSLAGVQVVNGNNVTRADLDGRIDLNNATTVNLRLGGDRVLVALGNATAPYQFQIPVTGTGPYVVAPSNDALTALNAYTAILDANNFARRALRPEEAQILTQSTRTRINVRGNCNAFYDPQVSAISLFAAGNGCANTALINDVTYHEWGHGLDNFTGRTQGITDGAFSEGIGDILSAYITSSNVLAPGFLVNDATGIRNLDNQARYPEGQGEVHVEGLIIGGAFWDMRKELVNRYGPIAGAAKAETYFLRHLLTTDSYLDSYQAVLRLDDDDGNPGTPSPNQCLINAAFAKHGIAQAENCTDKVAPPTIPLDETLAVGLLEASETGIKIMASSAKAANMGLCLGDKETCFKKSKPDFSLTREGMSANKVVFVTPQPLTISPLQVMTLIGLDAGGKPVGARMVRLIAK